jgi:hypothetical protein
MTDKIGKKQKMKISGRDYRCKDNDNVIRVIFVDNKIDEIQVSDACMDSWLVIGIKDIRNALKLKIK